MPENYPYDAPIPTVRSKIMAPLPTRVVAGYWTYWGSPIRLTQIPSGYNTVFLFHATPVGGAPGTTGAVAWNTPGNSRGAASNFKADLAEFRKNRTAILTVGGARANVDLGTRERAQAFVDSIKRIHADLGGFDGLDWNNYEGHQLPNTEQMIWISQQLKSAFGQSFAITSPPAPWRDADITHCKRMLDAGVMDMVSPQYYDGPGLADEAFIVNSVNQWVSRMGGASRVGVGFGLASATNYSSKAAVQGAWRQLSQRYPDLRGAFNWDLPTDEAQGWPFANDVAPLVKQGAPSAPPPPVVPPVSPTPGTRTHTVAAGETLGAIAQRYGVTWESIQAANGGIAPESLRVGQVLTIPSTQPSPTPSPAPAPNPTPVQNLGLPELKRGSTDRESVKTLQGLLVARGFAPANTIRADGTVDGGFGSGTQTAVSKFQEAVGLLGSTSTVKGVVGEPTWRKLLRL